ncbi:helix-turn-helix domain-containing protein [Natronorubrum sp. FCH18a]|uniref:winged helix-turn-helix transcriptional regulator n=1 Tax=Natronorubrum sp. FCH18a TaxID=3447018 RepID=UPI003F5182C9
MRTRSSVASRLLVSLVAVLLVGAGIAGAVTAVPPASGSTDLEPDGDSIEASTTETDGDLENTTDVLEVSTNETGDESENTTDDTTDEVENTTADLEATVDETADDLDESTNGTTADLENATDETIDSLENTTNETVDDLEDTAGGTTERLEEAVTEPIDSLTGGVAETAENVTTDPVVFLADVVTGGVETVGALPETVDVGLEASADVGSDSSDESDGESASAADSDDGNSSGGTSTATDAVLVGLLGAITASGAAASGAGAGAGASAGAGAGVGAGASASGAAGGASGAAGGASGLLARWLSQAGGLRHLRRVGSILPWELAPIFGYSRYDDSDPLENDRRRAVYETIQADSGCYLSQVSEESDVALSTVRHHVRVLEEEGLVTTAKVNGKRRYFLADGETPTEATDESDTVATVELHAALEEPAKRDVLETLAELGAVNNGRLADELERDPSTVSHHLSALEENGLVVREKDGRSVTNELTPPVEAALRDADPSLEDDSAASSSAPADD